MCVYIYMYIYISTLFKWCTTSQFAAIQLPLQLENIRRTIIIRRNYLHYIKRLAAKQLRKITKRIKSMHTCWACLFRVNLRKKETNKHTFYRTWKVSHSSGRPSYFYECNQLCWTYPTIHCMSKSIFEYHYSSSLVRLTIFWHGAHLNFGRCFYPTTLVHVPLLAHPTICSYTFHLLLLSHVFCSAQDSPFSLCDH